MFEMYFYHGFGVVPLCFSVLFLFYYFLNKIFVKAVMSSMSIFGKSILSTNVFNTAITMYCCLEIVTISGYSYYVLCFRSIV